MAMQHNHQNVRSLRSLASLPRLRLVTLRKQKSISMKLHVTFAIAIVLLIVGRAFHEMENNPQHQINDTGYNQHIL